MSKYEIGDVLVWAEFVELEEDAAEDLTRRFGVVKSVGRPEKTKEGKSVTSYDIEYAGYEGLVSNSDDYLDKYTRISHSLCLKLEFDNE